jgi:glutaredoxin 3
MARVLMYCTATCPYCIAAEELLVQKGVKNLEKVRVDLEPARRAEMSEKSGGRRTVPQIWVGDTHVGGCDDLHALDRAGGLDPLLAAG